MNTAASALRPWRVALLGAASTAFAMLACGGEAEPAEATDPPESNAAEEAVVEESPAAESTPPASPPPERAPAPDATRTHMDLGALVHLADRDLGPDEGLFVDFGTAARLKYTGGVWESGWASDRDERGVTYTPFGRLGRIYFPVSAGDAGMTGRRIHLRVKAIGGTRLMAFVNGEDVGGGPIGSEGYEVIRLDVPASVLRPGENTLLLRSDETVRRRGEDLGVAVDAMWIGPEGAEPPSPDVAEPLRGATESAPEGVARAALHIPASGNLTYTLPIPPDATLVLGAARAPGEETEAPSSDGDGRAPGPLLEIRATLDDGEVRTLESVPLGGRWQDRQIPLGDFARRHVRLELVARRAGARVSDLRIVIPSPAVDPIGDAAKNIIVLTIDTLRASKLRIYNRRSRVRTPALAAFAEQATLFERAQAPENWTKPSVASILTSLYPATHGAKNDGSRVSDDATFVSEVLQREGFRTAMFSANGYVSDAFGFQQGFHHYTNYIREERRTEAETVFREAGDWIERQVERQRERGEGRFFAYIQTIDPHVPYDPPDSFLDMYFEGEYGGTMRNRMTGILLERAKRDLSVEVFDEEDRRRLEALHDAEISYHDHHLARFLARISELGLDENTIFVITSDHGEEFQEHGSWGHGHSIFQELLHVPLMVRWPGVAPAGVRIPDVVTTLDIAPTVLDAADVTPPADFEGRSLMGYLRGLPPPGPRVAFSDYQEIRRVIRSEDMKLVLRSNGTHVLFDLAADPGEHRELDGREHPVSLRALRILSGVFLGASDRRGWILGRTGEARSLRGETEMTRELCEQLRRLGYIVGDCATMPSERD